MVRNSKDREQLIMVKVKVLKDTELRINGVRYIVKAGVQDVERHSGRAFAPAFFGRASSRERGKKRGKK